MEPVDSKKPVASKCRNQCDPFVRFPTASKRAANDEWLESIQEPNEYRNPQNSPCSDTSSCIRNPSPGFCTQCPLPHAPYCAYDGSPHRFCVYCGHFSLDLSHSCRYLEAFHRQKDETAHLLKRLRSPAPSPSPAPPDITQKLRYYTSSEYHSEDKNAFSHLEKD